MTLRVGITCYPTFGGSGIIATEIGIALARRGHEVHFICSDMPSRLQHFEPNVYFHAVEVRDYPLFDKSPYALALASKMVDVTTHANLDLLHVHYAVPHATSAYLARQILGPRAPKIVTTLHGTDITLVGNDPGFLPITRFSILESDAVTVPSAYLARATRENFGIGEDRAIELIPNFVDENAFQPAAARDRTRLWRLFPEPPPTSARVLVHNSNFRPLKRVDDVVHVLEAVRATMPAVLIFIGDGPERSRIEQLVRERGLARSVCFLGNQLAFASVLADADVFLLTSQTESFGLAALEALACGVPVVATRTGGVPEVVTAGENGFLCEVGDIDGIAGAVLRIIGDDALLAAMTRAARARVERDFGRAPAIDRYESCYRRVLAPPKTL
jgi:N-acetyl-alpha-D-glucosaminyl L-malate synthase BshA